MAAAPSTYLFGGFSLDVARRLLWKGDDLPAVGQKAVEILLCLVESAGKVVTKEELLSRVWPDTFVEEANLSVQISSLRKVLGEQADGRPFIETIPRRGYRFVAPVEAESRPTPPRALAVLPLQCLAGPPGEEYVGVGLADVLITRLSNIGQILVRPTSAVAKYATRERDAARAARELAVDVVLDGRWQHEGDRVRVTVQLVRAADGSVIWADTLEEAFTHLFRVQDALAHRLASALALKIGSAEEARLSERATEDARAYQAYLRGRYLWNKLTPAFLVKAREAFSQAVALDPTYARAHAGLADTDVVLAIYGEMPPRELLEQARAEAERALELDEGLAEAHTSLAYVYALADWSVAKAEEHLRCAVAITPRSAGAHQWYALFLAMTGRLMPAMAEILEAQKIDPLSLTVHTNLGFQHYLGGQADEELEAHARSLELEPDYAIGHWALGLAYALKGAHAQAIAAQERAVELTGGSPLMKTVLARYLALDGKTEPARALLDELTPLAESGRVSPYRMATIHTAFDEIDRAFEWLERGYATRDLWMVWMAIDPMLANLHDDPRSADLIARVGFSEG